MKWLLAALAVVLLAPSASFGDVIEARTILPPGQSGIPGAAHTFDQLQPYQDLQYKPEPLGGGPGGTPAATPRAGVTIRRDGFGVPAIKAGTDAAVWGGAGYAVAQDRLGGVGVLQRPAAGRLAGGPRQGPP